MTRLNYHGFDSQENQEIFKNNLILLETEIRKRYINRLETFNKENLEQNPEPFRFLNSENCSILAITLPIEIDNRSNSIFYFLSTPSTRNIDIIILDDDKYSDLDSYKHINYFFTNKIFPEYNLHESQIILRSGGFYDRQSYDYDIFSKSININKAIEAMALEKFAIDAIKNETQEFKQINQTELSYFAKDAFKFPFSIIDLKPLINLVNDEDFKYQLDQAMAAYHENLFLPCASTLGVVLETLCIKILEENKVKKVKSGDTQLGVLKDRLHQEGITSRRDHTRLEVAYKMRNMASHTSPGVALKEDCHFMLNVINTIAFEYLQQND